MKQHAILGFVLVALVLASSPALAGPRKMARNKAPQRSGLRVKVANTWQRLLPRRASVPRRSVATASGISRRLTTTSPRQGKLRRKVRGKLNKLNRQFKEWWRWQTKKDWKLIETHATDYVGMNASSLNPYFWNVWKDLRTGKTRITTDY